VDKNGDLKLTTTVAQAVGTAVVFESAATIYCTVVYDASSQKIVIAYTDQGNSDYGTAIVGTVSGTSISFGSPVVFASASTEYISGVYDENAQKVVLAYRDGGNSDYGTAIVGTVSGTSISFGSETVFVSGQSSPWGNGAVYDANAQKVVITYQPTSDNTGYAIVGTVSGTSISFGTASQFESGATYAVSTAYDSDNQKVVIAFKDSGDSNYGKALVATVSGTSISFGSAVTFESANTSDTSAVYDPDSQKIVIAFKDGGSTNDGTAIVGTVSGTSISFGSPVVFETGRADESIALYDTNAQKVVIVYQDSDNSDHGTFVVGTVSGTSISFDSPVVFESAETGHHHAAYDANAQKIVTAFRDAGNSNYGTATVIETGSDTSGSLSTDAVPAGTALSATKLLVKG